jgi:hypothetical protein
MELVGETARAAVTPRSLPTTADKLLGDGDIVVDCWGCGNRLAAN